eukprot:TRINITY_DN1158_c0_g1_i1.p1 TRINITY_DN1158_c0_g1~~TRINITY_DN1158_c0_g1_i1.p1  ORF type:complete len:329 (+),score=103.98 TRINITY_DN1158_c0_g1_i1:45-1031(+)
MTGRRARTPRAMGAALWAAALLAVAAAAGKKPKDCRTVRWYVDASDVAGNQELVSKHGAVVTGLVGTAGGEQLGQGQTVNGMVVVDEQGEVGVFNGGNASYIRDISKPFVEAEHKINFHIAVTVAQEAISGAKANQAVAGILNISQAARVTGVLVDYEPTSDLRPDHQKLYQDFLSHLLAEAAARRKKEPGSPGLEVAMVVADSGIIRPSATYAKLGGGLAWYTSMSPTLSEKGSLSPSGQVFLKDMTMHFGNRTSVSIGAMAAAGFEDKCERDFEWDMNTLQEFLNELHQNDIDSIDVMRCDLANGMGQTAPYFYDRIQKWLDQDRC